MFKYVCLVVGIVLLFIGIIEIIRSYRTQDDEFFKEAYGWFKVIGGIAFISIFIFAFLKYPEKINSKYLITVYDRGNIEEMYTGWNFSTDGSAFSYTDENGEHTVDFTGKEITHEKVNMSWDTPENILESARKIVYILIPIAWFSGFFLAGFGWIEYAGNSRGILSRALKGRDFTIDGIIIMVLIILAFIMVQGL